MLRASEPVPEIRFVNDVEPTASRVVNDRWERHVPHPVAHRLITDTQQLAHRSRRVELGACTANDGAITAERA